jgi:hypothetical protein
MIHEAALKNFRAALRGQSFCPGEPHYDEAHKVWNAMVDKRPALIARCTGAADVVQSVKFAREQGLAVSVHGGGHSIAGNAVAKDGLMIDLSPMKGMRVDPARGKAWSQAGLKLGEFDRESQAFGLATTLGIATDTGISGLTLGGGYGWLGGKHGLACDNVLSMDIVTADGRLLTASVTENQDLFWCLRSAGANFGVVTAIEYQLHKVGPVLAGLVMYPMSKGKEALRLFDEFSKACPDEATTLGLLMSTPDGTSAVGIAVCYCGPLSEGEKVLKPLRTFGPPLADLIAVRSYLEMQSFFDAPFVPGQLNYWKTSVVRGLSETAIDILLEYAQKRPTPTSVIYLQQLHGAASRVGASDTAFPHRFDHYSGGPWAIWNDPADSEKCLGWGRECWNALRPFYEPGVYVNDLGDEPEERVRTGYGPNYMRLAALKDKYDPTNFFHLNANIKPAQAAPAATSA